MTAMFIFTDIILQLTEDGIQSVMHLCGLEGYVFGL